MPDFHRNALTAPLQCLPVGAVKKINTVRALNGPAGIFNTAITIPRDVHNRAKRIIAPVGGDRAAMRSGA